jgi:hypothetical protein
MSRITTLEALLFPVAEHPVFVSIKDHLSERRLPVRDKKALINATTQHVLGIVSTGYKVVTNAEALELGRRCCAELFPKISGSEWTVARVDAPSGGGFCHLDLTHKTCRLAPAGGSPLPDVFAPFVRVTNSYNTQRALRFDVGYFRYICTNGVVLPKAAVKFEFVHTKRALRDAIRFDVKRDHMEKLDAEFAGFIEAIRACIVPAALFQPLLTAVLGLRKPSSFKDGNRDADEWASLESHLTSLTDRYIKELGENAYALFNTVTDFASHPPANRHVHRDRHSLERRAGEWLSDFSAKCRADGFDVEKYHVELLSEKSKTTIGAN